jgi:hypothetical protein
MNTSLNCGVEQLQIIGNKVLMRAMKLAIGLMPIRDPELLVGTSAVTQLADIIAQHSLQKILIVTTAGIARGALKEALLNYPVPRHMTRLDCEQLLGGLLPA